ncbi:phosphopantetheine-binding protein [Dictyobacter arantiisoli]|uniref:Uncharacterized protein n=1 Tax=Dictyobacter arantiisoli TaxID=2014874 RepID=A0A5A5T8H4_9CHLR|nr:phosphopantetheine-binding protein [Dictyobacter arantiisoli]GCF07279.1 hypothetical protein KDI_08430 [Dictyobacter arantiisoli]
MDRALVLRQVKDYFTGRVLDDIDEDLDEYTPLLDWGFINSLEIAQLVAFIHVTYGLDVPPEKMVPAVFQNLQTITQMIMEIPLPVVH